MTNIKNKSYSNRGIGLEKIINNANAIYQNKQSATVVKIPTPTKILYKNCNGYRLPIKAFYSEKSWLDYIGVVNGVPITFDAKETTNKTSFPLNNVKEHQIRAMQLWNKCKGISFLIVWWKQFNEFYLLPYEILIEAWEKSKRGERKSIPYEQFKKEAIHINYKIYLDWLTAYKNYRSV